MINKIDRLHERHSYNFVCHARKQTAGLLCVVSYHHEIVVELGEYGFYTFAESPVCPGLWMSVFLIQPIWNFKSDIGCLKENSLNLSTEIAFLTKHHVVMISPAYILEIMEVMVTCCRRVIRVYATMFPTDSMEFISIVLQTLRGAISPVSGSLRIVTPNDTTLRSCVLADLYGVGFNTEHILGTVNDDSHVPVGLFGKPCRQLTAGIELYQVLANHPCSHDTDDEKGYFHCRFRTPRLLFPKRLLRDPKTSKHPTPEFISRSIRTIPGEILACHKDSDEFCYEVAHKQGNS